MPKQSMGGRVVAVGLVTFLVLSIFSSIPTQIAHLDENPETYNTSAVNIV